MRKILGMLLAIALAGAALLAIPANVSAQATPLDWNVGSGWYFGNTVDFNDLQEEIDQGLQDLPPGFDANVNVAGGIGAYLGLEVVDDAANVNGYTCYQVDINGAVGIDFGMDASVDGTYSEQGMSISVDASGNAIVMGEANLLISLFFTADEARELVKAQLEFTADAEAEASIDAVVDMDLGGFSGLEGFDTNQHFDVSAELTATADNVLVTGSIEFDPPLDFFDFPIYQGDVWWVPQSGTEISTEWSASGTVDIDVDVTGIPNEPDVHEHQTMNLATEIGSGSDSTIVQSWETVMFECVAVYGNNYIIETEMGNYLNFFDWGGVRQYGLDYLDMLPVDDVIPENAGVAYNADEGMVTGMTIDGEVQTASSDKATVDSFAADPLGEVQETTGGHGSVGTGSSGLLPLLILGIIVIVVVLVVVAMMASRGKKKKQQEMYGAPPPQQYQQQPYQGQYQQPPPPQPQPQYPDQQPPPPPPPPPGY